MRSMCRKVLVGLAVVFALSAATVSSAFAAPEWYAKKAGVFTKLTGTLNVQGTAELNVTDTQYNLGSKEITVACDVNVEGTIKPGGVGTITGYTPTTCAVTPKADCEGAVTSIPVHLPWKTELYTEGGAIRQRLVSGGSGTPGWEFECTYLGMFGHPDLCSFNTSSAMFNEAPGVIAEFEAKSNNTACSRGESNSGSKETGRLRGIVEIEAPEGVEAIKVK